MYHERFKKSHYEAGFHYGKLLYEHGKIICHQPTFKITEERKKFAESCLPIYEKYYPEILEEIKGLAMGQHRSYEDFYTFLLSMYCFEFNPHCTCIAMKDPYHILFGRNSDFLVSLEKLSMNVLYKLDHVYAFNGHTTAFIEMEDGINEYGLAVGLTFVYPTIIKAGLNAGMLVRYLLEKCQSTKEALSLLKKIPIASQQTLTIADRSGDIVVVECNSEKVEIMTPDDENDFVVATNRFHLDIMKPFNHDEVDDWRAEERYLVASHTLEAYKDHFSLDLMKDILAGKYGFMCQYDRNKNADTIWSVIYDIKNSRIYRAEGNPRRKSFKIDTRLKFKDEF